MWRIESPLDKLVSYLLDRIKSGVYSFSFQELAKVSGVTFYVEFEGSEDSIYEARGSLPRFMSAMSPLFARRSDGCGSFFAEFRFAKKPDIIDHTKVAYYQVEKDITKRHLALMIRIGIADASGLFDKEQVGPKLKTLTEAFRDQLLKAVREEREKERERGVPSLGSKVVVDKINELLFNWAELKGCLRLLGLSTEELLRYEPRTGLNDDDQPSPSGPRPSRKFKGRRPRLKTDRL